MAIATACPVCEARFSVRDDLLGKKVRCKNCGGVFAVVECAIDAQDGLSTGRKEAPPPRAAAVPVAMKSKPRRINSDEDEERFRRRGSSGSNSGLIIALCVGVGLLLLLVLGLGLFLALRPRPGPEASPAVAEQPNPLGLPFPKAPPGFPDLRQLPRQQDGVPPNADAITLAVSKLKSGDVFSESDAAKWLEKAKVVEGRRAEVVAALKAIIDNHRPLVPRCDALKALGTWATRADTPYLVGLLDDNDGGVKQEALWALAKVKDPSAAEAIVAVYPHHRNEAREALLAIGPGAEAAVRTLLRHQDMGVRIEACKILKKIGTPASHPALLQLAEEEEGGVADAARDALPARVRPPVYGPRQTIRVCVVNGGRFPQQWPMIEAKFKALADSPRPRCKVNTSGECKWVELTPVNSDAETFSRKINFGKVTAVHNDQRLVYVELR